MRPELQAHSSSNFRTTPIGGRLTLDGFFIPQDSIHERSCVESSLNPGFYGLAAKKQLKTSKIKELRLNTRPSNLGRIRNNTT
ncbi:hypothetical protein AVEN_28702-1 [Araneus ventricosus]|uniref:Uncharacterized protein n=1 Tax=Araneus ventricosus TaxID=182803 RepID=A0A4Y2J5C7_ARAVE|nr:hypothetical protein AVEN_28702-1 [Araneus ventricosus]